MNSNFCKEKQELVIVPDSMMTDEDLCAVKYVINEFTDTLVGVEYIGMDEFKLGVGLDYVNKDGKFIRRVLNFLYKTYGIRLPQETLDKLSNAYKRIYVDQCQINVVVDVVDTFHWQDNRFGKSGSCWWNEYPQSRQTLDRAGGICLRRFSSMEDKIGIGRVWLYPYNSGFLIFNLYGWTYGEVKSVVKELYGIEYPLRPVRITNDLDFCTPYINSDTCCMLDTCDYEDEIVVSWPKVRGDYGDYQCEKCQKVFFYYSQVTEYDDGTIVCDNCAGYNGKCKSCGNKTKDSDLCDYCAKYANDDFNFQDETLPVDVEVNNESIPEWILHNGVVLTRNENGGDVLLNDLVYTLVFNYDENEYDITNIQTVFAYNNPQAECLFKQPR